MTREFCLPMFCLIDLTDDLDVEDRGAASHV